VVKKLLIYTVAALCCALLATVRLGAQETGTLFPARNATVSVPLGQGLEMVHAGEPLGKGRFRLRLLNRSHSVVLQQLGQGSSYTGSYGIAYGLSPSLDFSFLLPFLMDSAGGLNKYGSGDVVVGVKWSRPSKIPANFYSAFQMLLSLPLGYKGEHGLDEIGGVRSYSSEAIDLGLQYLMDLNFDHVSLLLNGGYFVSGNPNILPELVYGLGLEVGRRRRWASFNIEYQARVAFTEQSNASGVLKLGTRLNLFRGTQLELNREFGFLNHPTAAVFTFGLRFHGFLSGRRRLESRYTLYQPPPKVKREYAPENVLRLAIVGFGGFEELQAGQRLVDKLKAHLEPHDSIEVVDLSRYANIPRKGFLRQRQAVELAQKLGVDVVLTGRVEEFDINRFGGKQVPYLILAPEAVVEVAMRYRIIEFSNRDKLEIQAYSNRIKGKGRLRKRVQLLHTDRRDITSAATAREMVAVQDDALDDLVDNLLATMATQFTWVPPDFAP